MKRHHDCARFFRLIFFLTSCLILSSCHKSKEPDLYSLNPTLFSGHATQTTNPVRIGIDSITLPEYLDHSQLIVFVSPHQSKLYENKQWAEPLDTNVKRVIQTNLSNRLPRAAIQLAPWSSDFFPQYHLRVDVTQFKVDTQGNSFLQAIFYIESDKRVIHDYQVQLYEKLPVVNPDTIVVSMNKLINQLSDKIAYHFH